RGRKENGAQLSHLDVELQFFYVVVCVDDVLRLGVLDTSNLSHRSARLVMGRKFFGVDLIPDLLEIENLLLVLDRLQYLVHAFARKATRTRRRRILLLHLILFLPLLLLQHDWQSRANEIRSEASRSVHTILYSFFTIACVFARNQRQILGHHHWLVGTRSVVKHRREEKP
ncbi:hypothetical protein PMAYCL1PPCAC_30989, partial [Pristionchus mayeri]